MKRFYNLFRREDFKPEPQPQIVYVDRPAEPDNFWMFAYAVGIAIGLLIAWMWVKATRE